LFPASKIFDRQSASKIEPLPSKIPWSRILPLRPALSQKERGAGRTPNIPPAGAVFRIEERRLPHEPQVVNLMTVDSFADSSASSSDERPEFQICVQCSSTVLFILFHFLPCVIHTLLQPAPTSVLSLTTYADCLSAQWAYLTHSGPDTWLLTLRYFFCSFFCLYLLYLLLSEI